MAPGDVGEAAAVAAKEGAGWVKLIGDWPRKGLGPVANFDEAALGEAVAAAREHEGQCGTHHGPRSIDGSSGGVDSIEHGLFLSDHDLEMLGARGGCWVPTVVQMEATISQLGERSSGGRLLIEGLENVRARLGAAVDAGVHVLTGTDLVIGSHEVAREAVRLWEMGLAPEAVIAVSWSGFGLPAVRGRSTSGSDRKCRAVLRESDIEPACPDRSRSRDPLGPGGLMRLLLASGSPRRRELLERLGLEFDFVAPEVDETRFPDEAPAAYVERVARSKAAQVAGDSLIVVAADTTVVHEGRGHGQARASRGSGDAASYPGGCSRGLHRSGHRLMGWEPRIRSVVDVAEVTMLAMTEEEIAWYVGTGEPLDKAGAYALQGLGGCSSAASWVAPSR